MALSARQCVEMFHLVLLRALAAKGQDKALIALKGGCNLRFYFGSVRYSEDIDFDVVVLAPGTLKNKVERLLHSALMTAPLKTQGIEITDSTAPKQTDTTQRWKVGLRARHIEVPIRTKIEFSRRDEIDAAAFESVGRELLRPYGLTQVLATHYTVHAAIDQKIHALAGRAEPQARDIFDLNLLLSRPDVGKAVSSAAQLRRLPDAIEHAISISFDEYRAKVVAYLDPEQAALYESRAAWDAMQDAVVAQLQGLQ
ncbi:MAG TPA: nucleotidyl transferase AbiEii/AbiGii toxin family protein [Polyangiales bacterium]